MKRIITIVLTAMMILTMFTGCAKATYIDSSTFNAVMTERNFSVVNGKESWLSEDEKVKEAFIASSPDGWQIEYYRLETTEFASYVFHENTGENKASGAGTTTRSRSGDSAVFKHSGTDTYYIVVQAAAMVIYCEAPKAYEEDVDRIFIDLGVFS